MPDFTQGKIYRIRSKNCHRVYVGSTTQTLSDRLLSHISDSNRYITGRCVYISSVEILVWGDCIIELLEEYPCISKKELEHRERYWIQQEENCVNLNLPGRNLKKYKSEWYFKNKDRNQPTTIAYRQEHKNEQKKLSREWYLKNKDAVLAKQKQNRENKNQISIV